MFSRPAVVLLALALLSPSRGVAAPPPGLSSVDRVRIAEAFRIADALGDRVWPAWSKAPFAVLLVTPEHEFLIRHPKPTTDFTEVGRDPVLKTKVWVRPRTYPTNFLATFPAVNGVSTIVIGQAENTQANDSARWVITLLHEHFHQLQDSQPGFFADVEALGLSRGDKTGMWMLNYPFPYARPDVVEAHAVVSRALCNALRSRQQPDFGSRVAIYLEAETRFRALLPPDDYKYFEFQLWKEGVARYTEFRLARLASTDYKPSKEFQRLQDYRSFAAVEDEIIGHIVTELDTVKLDKAERTVVYNFGAAAGLVLDRATPGWQSQYFTKKFSLDPYFPAGR
jgi:hypothetical protein